MLLKLVPALIMVAGAGLAGLAAKKNASEENKVSHLEQALAASRNSNVSVTFNFDVKVDKEHSTGSVGFTFADGHIRFQPPKKEQRPREKQKPHPGAFMAIRGPQGMRTIQALLTANPHQIAENYVICERDSEKMICGRPTTEFDIVPKRLGRKNYKIFVDKTTSSVLGISAVGEGFALSLNASSVESVPPPEFKFKHVEKRPRPDRKPAKRMEAPEVLPGGFRRVPEQVERPIFLFGGKDLMAMYSDGLEVLWIVKYDESVLDKWVTGAHPDLKKAYEDFKKNPQLYLPRFLSIATAKTAGGQCVICLSMLDKKETENIAAYFAGGIR